ncbi:MAG: CHAP domain-containing protein [Alphaproteobacteria bacterium]|nr:CHAP domain-containing protein [Alphaproteobacteria bacterium]
MFLAGLSLAACGSTGDYGSPRVVSRDKGIQCVPFARAESGVDLYGDANTWWDKARGKYERETAPEEGAVMVLKGYKRSDRGHVAVVKAVVDDREIVIDHANWLNDGKIYLDQPVRDVSEGNDWSEVRVWYAPGAQYGARIYDVEGFILPHPLLADAR